MGSEGALKGLLGSNGVLMEFNGDLGGLKWI